MTRRPVHSSVLASVGYEPLTMTLEVEFVSGSVYRYHRVPELTYRRLLTAPSLGRFFNDEVRDLYRSELRMPPIRAV